MVRIRCAVCGPIFSELKSAQCQGAENVIKRAVPAAANPVEPSRLIYDNGSFREIRAELQEGATWTERPFSLKSSNPRQTMELTP